MPATCALVGTPASISARLAPHTDAIDELPFDSVISETTRIEYANSSTLGSIAEQRALGEAAVADLAALRRADAAGFAGGVRRHVVVEHEAVAVLAHQRVDDLLVARGAERGHDHRLRLAAREQRRAVRTRQHAGADADRAHGARVAAVDARLAGEDLLADDLRLEVEHEVRRPGSSYRRRRRRECIPLRPSPRFPSGAAGAPASSAAGRRRAAARLPRSPPWRSSPRPSPPASSPTRGLPASSTSEWMSSITACCCWCPNTTAPSITSSGSSFASDSTISTAASVPATTRFERRRRQLGLGRIEHDWPSM